MYYYFVTLHGPNWLKFNSCYGFCGWAHNQKARSITTRFRGQESSAVTLKLARTQKKNTFFCVLFQNNTSLNINGDEKL